MVIKDQYDKFGLPQVWDELRRKVGDVQRDLPPGASSSIVNDDYGDVFGIFFTVSGEGYSYAELKDVVDFLRRELLLVPDVGKIATYGERTESIHVDLSRDRMSQLGIPEDVIINELRQRNVVANAGRVKVGPEYITINPTGEITEVSQFESILISGGASQQIYLRDVADVSRGYVEPRTNLVRYDGKTAIGVGISTVSGGNVVTMGERLIKRMDELLGQIPAGIEFGRVSIQSEAVDQAISGFIVSLIEAVVIVIVVLLFFMGLRSGLLIGFVLLVTICGSFIFMAPMEVALERISLGALIIALGMLVDNAIVVVDGVLVRLQKGEDAKQAAIEVVKQTAIPLLGATIIAILAFAAIGTSDDSTGEFCRSLFQVVLVSLLLSWVTAVSVTPLLCVMFLKPPKVEEGAEVRDPYGGAVYTLYKNFIRTAIRMKVVVFGVVVALFISALMAFGYVDQTFFPPSTRLQFMLDLWLPQGTHINETSDTVESIEQYVGGLEGVTHTSSFIGQGGLRFMLTFTPEKLNSSYAQLLVDVESSADIIRLGPEIEAHMRTAYPNVLAYTSLFQLGPGSVGKIQARISGPDRDVLRGLAGKVMAIYQADPDSKGIRTNWRQRVKVVRPVLAEEQANLNGITRPDIATAMLQAFDGAQVGIYREEDLLLPIILRAEEDQRMDVSSMNNIQIWSPAARAMIPIRQVVSEFRTTYEDEIIERRNRKPTITVYADPDRGLATSLFARVRPQVEALELPGGYELEWGGEYEDSSDAQAGLMASIPAFVVAMILITIALFNSLKQPLIIWLCVPLALIGVSWGLLATGQPFGFMALLGFLSLSGMLIKNAIVLIDEINIQKSSGKELIEAIIDAGASRLRPVGMAASTTALGLIPLLFDAFFISLAVTIIAGLLFATILTMVVVPVLYATFYSREDKPEAAGEVPQPA